MPCHQPTCLGRSKQQTFSLPYKVEGRAKGHPRTGHEDAKREQRYSCTLLLTSALDEGGWTPPHGRFTPGKDPVSIVQEAGWDPEPVRTGAENHAPTGIRSPDLPGSASATSVTITVAPLATLLVFLSVPVHPLTHDTPNLHPTCCYRVAKERT